MTDDLTRDFKGVWIPKEIWLDDRLNTIDKIVLLEIDSLDTTEEGCYASNKYLANFCKCTETTVSTSINKLIKLDYLELIKFDGRKRYLKSRVTKIERQTLKNLKADFKKFKDINIDNNIDNNIINNIINYLNEKTDSNYRSTTRTTKSKIQARLNEGFTIDDFKKVIDKKYEEWVDTDFEKFLRPETLFGTKFESYLNQKEKGNTPNWFYKDLDKQDTTDEEFDKLLKEIGE